MIERLMIRVFAATCIACLLLVISPPTTAQSVTLKGTVNRRDSAAQGIESARVEFRPGGYVAVSDRNGRFVVSNFRPGTYDITVREGGNYEIFRQEITGDQLLILHVSW